MASGNALSHQVCPVLEIHSRNVGGILEDYVFCGERKGWRCAVLGYGMMYNSWMHANLAYYRCVLSIVACCNGLAVGSAWEAAGHPLPE